MALSQNTRARRPSNPAIGHEATGDDASAQLEYLFHLGVSNDGFAQFRIQQAGHGVFDLVEQFINNAVKLDLHAFAFCGRNRHGLDLHVEADDHCVGCTRQQNVRFRNRSDGRMNNFQIDFFALDLLQRVDDCFDGTLRVGFQNDPQPFFASGGFKQGLESGALRHEKLVRALCLKSLVAQLLGGALRFHNEEFVARIRQSGKPENLHRCRRRDLLDGFTPVVEEGFYLSAVVAANKWVADLQCPHLHDYGGGRPSAAFNLCLDDRAARSCGR